MKAIKIKNFLCDIGAYLVLILSCLVTLLPFLWIISTSLKNANEVFASPPRWIPVSPTIKNYVLVFTKSNLPIAFINSFIIGLITAFISLVIGGLAGYGFARFQFKLNQPLSFFMIVSQLLPITMLMIPLYFLINEINLLDTKIGVVIAHLSVALPMTIWMTKGYFSNISRELEEAANLDGCNTPQMIWYILLPLIRPALAATGIYAFITSWNDFVFSSVLTLSMNSKTLPLTLSEFSTYASVDWGQTMAAATIISVPVIIAFMFIQKQFVEGMTAGAVKG
jgi:ABC-type glycerol-3-phosphate transport system permease component